MNLLFKKITYKNIFSGNLTQSLDLILRHDQEREKFFFLLLRSLRHDQERKEVFFHLVTMFTTPWSREKNFFFSFQHYIHYAMATRKINWYLFQHYLDYATIIKIYPFFISQQLSRRKYILTSPCVANLPQKTPNDILPRKICLT